jgi:hypothetical protein
MLSFFEKRKVKEMMGEEIILSNGDRKICNVVAVLNKRFGKKEYIPGANIVTNDGDLYYAQRGAAETPTNTYVGFRLGSASTTPTKTDTDVTTFLATSGKVTTATYPKTNDGDADNTGAGTDIVSWSVSYTTSEANGTIAELAIVDNIVTPTTALTHALFSSSFTKTSSDTLKVFVNHTMNGV